MSTFMSRSSLCYIQISIKTFIFHIIRGQSHRSQTILGRFKISSQTNIIGAGTARTEIPDISCQTQQAGISQNKDRFCQGDREDLNQISYMFPPSPGLSFLCFPTQRLYFKFIICVQLTYLKLSSVEKIYLHLSLTISTYCLLTYTHFTELRN